MDVVCDIVDHIVYYIVRQDTTSYVRIRHHTSGYDIVNSNTISLGGLFEITKEIVRLMDDIV
jgi:hypothetical protein